MGWEKKWTAVRNIGKDMETHEVQELDNFTIYIQINLPSMINN